MKNGHSILKSILFGLLLVSCGSSKVISTTNTTYVKRVDKKPENISVSYMMPTVKPNVQTKQLQVKGGVTISCQVIPFVANRNLKTQRNAINSDPDKPGYDVFEISNTPEYNISPDQINFKVNVKNSTGKILKLRELGIILMVDNVQFSFPEHSLDEFQGGIILNGFDKDYLITGPKLNSLNNAKVIFFSLQDVPTSYDQAGNTTKKDTYEWYFESDLKNVIKEDQKTYSYETSLIESAQCPKCSGTGTDPQAYQCTTCKGTGVTKNIFDGKTYQCSTCKGTGVVHYKCGNCSGRGILYYPKSPRPQIEKSETWTGAKVQIITAPAGAKISVVNTNTGEYENKGISNITVDWYSSNSKSYPIVIEYQGQTVKVLPYDATGKLISKVEIDFLSGTPIIKKGSKVN